MYLKICKSESCLIRVPCSYLDRLITAVNPRKLLFMSVDGVAPKAKVKEQRGRRFRSGYVCVYGT